MDGYNVWQAANNISILASLTRMFSLTCMLFLHGEDSSGNKSSLYVLVYVSVFLCQQASIGST